MQVNTEIYLGEIMSDLLDSKSDNRALIKNAQAKSADYKNREAKIKAKNPILEAVPSIDETLLGVINQVDVYA